MAETMNVHATMTPDVVLDVFRTAGALLEGHFRLTSGLHSGGYMQCALVLQYPEYAERLGAALASRLAVHDANVVLSPALGGIVIGQEVARALRVRALFAERQEGVLTLRRGFTLGPTDRVLVIEDVVTTGGSTRETIDVARAAGALVVAAGSIVNRGATTELGVPYEALAKVSLPAYDPATCPLCAQGLAVVKPGSRA